jgi:hypothetical protein
MAPNPLPEEIQLMLSFLDLVSKRTSGDQSVTNEHIAETLRRLQELNALSPVVVFLLHAYDFEGTYNKVNQMLEEASEPINTDEVWETFDQFSTHYDGLLGLSLQLMRAVVCGLGHSPSDDKEVKDRAKLIIEEKSEGHLELVILMMGYEKVQEVYARIYQREKEIFH